MPNELTTSGLTVKTLQEIVDDLVAGMQTIYGADINVSQNSPDGQLINIFAQAAEDNLELLLATYNSFAVQAAYGIYLDQRVALNGITRQAGTHTITNVTIITNAAVNLVGVDALVNDPTAIVYTLSDDNGVLYDLVNSTSIGSAGTNVLEFQAHDLGVIQPIQNTITNQVTIVQGVTSVNNPDAATTIGQAEETDSQLKIRQTQSFYLAATGPADSIEAALLAIPGMTDAFVAENNTDSPVSGVPAYSIWAIVDGGTDAQVGQAIYAKKSPGCGMKGSDTYVVNRPNATTFTAKFDRALNERLYVAFTITPKRPGIVFDAPTIQAELAAYLIYRLNQPATIGDVVIAMNILEPFGILSAVGVSINGTNYFDIRTPSDYQHKFHLAAADVDVTIP